MTSPTGRASATRSARAVSFDSDWRFPSEHSRHIVDVLRAAGVEASHGEVSSPWGHDSFLLANEDYHRLVAEALWQEAPARAGRLHGTVT